MSPDPTTATDEAPPNAFDHLADIVDEFAEIVEVLLSTEFNFPFTIGSDALRDCAANESHQGTQSKQILTTLATSQVRAGYLQCDLYRGIAAALRAPKVFFAPFPLARTTVVIAAKAWHILDAGSRAKRLQRYLNEELAALHDAPLDPEHDDSQKYVDERTEDYVSIGATAGLRLGRRKNARRWDAPFLVNHDEPVTQTPISESQLVRSIIESSGLGDGFHANLPYSLLSAATHGRFHRAGVTTYTPAGPSESGVTVTAMHVRIEVLAVVTMYAALSTLTYLYSLARYMQVPEDLVRERLRSPMSAWNDVAQST